LGKAALLFKKQSAQDKYSKQLALKLADMLIVICHASSLLDHFGMCQEQSEIR
jgi:hypothetical protein